MNSDVIDAVCAAARVCRYVQGRLTEASRIVKADRSPVTIADFAAQAVVARGLRDRLGVASILAEESPDYLREPAQRGVLEAITLALRESGAWADARAEEVLEAIAVGSPMLTPDASRRTSFWTLDPIDGTRGFLRGQQYSVCLARIERGRPVLGVLGCPNLSADFAHPFDVPASPGFLFFATHAGGAWSLPLDQPWGAPTRLTRSAWDDSTPHHPSITFSVDPSSARRDQLTAIRQALGATRTPAQLDSQCKYAVVARGQADAYFRPPRSTLENTWDHAAGCLLVAEAGCVVSDVDGLALDFSRPHMEGTRGVLAAPPGLHERMLAAIARTMPGV